MHHDSGYTEESFAAEVAADDRATLEQALQFLKENNADEYLIYCLEVMVGGVGQDVGVGFEEAIPLEIHLSADSEEWW